MYLLVCFFYFAYICIAHFLSVITESNDTFTQIIYQNQQAIPALFVLLADGSNSPLFRVNVASSALNITKPEHFGKVLEAVLPVLNVTMKFDGLTAILPLVAEIVNSEEDTEAVKFWRSCVTAQRSSFELLANITSLLAYSSVEDEEVMVGSDDEDEPSADHSSDNAVSKNPEFVQFVSTSQILTVVCCTSY